MEIQGQQALGSGLKIAEPLTGVGSAQTGAKAVRSKVASRVVDFIEKECESVMG
jgi:hypothetical protein